MAIKEILVCDVCGNEDGRTKSSERRLIGVHNGSVFPYLKETIELCKECETSLDKWIEERKRVVKQ